MVDEPMIMNNMIKNKDAAKLAQVTETFLKMENFNIAEFIKIYEK